MRFLASLKSSALCFACFAALGLGCSRPTSSGPGSSALSIVDGMQVGCPRTRAPDLRQTIVYGPQIQCTTTDPGCPAGS